MVPGGNRVKIRETGNIAIATAFEGRYLQADDGDFFTVSGGGEVALLGNVDEMMIDSALSAFLHGGQQGRSVQGIADILKDWAIKLPVEFFEIIGN